MIIIIDTREQLPLAFTGHETVRRKLDEGDYNIKELKRYIVIERKTLQDLYGSIIKGHARFKNEIVRSRLQNKAFYIFLEGSLEMFYSLKWAKRKLHIKPFILKQIIKTMQERYQITIIECENREIMQNLIVQTLDINRKLYGVDGNGKRN
jgi:ERCC4-type nuclease